jgi:SAM-dependent methyltransferase
MIGLERRIHPASRSLKWVSAVDPRQTCVLETFQADMRRFYAENESYYSEIDYASAGWMDDGINLEMVRRLGGADRILEVGCGSANILESYPAFIPRYDGCDLSPTRVATCAERYPRARFRVLDDPRKLPFPDNSFDAVFSIFVIEHTVFPHIFLNESIRVLKPKGLFMLRCPDFLGAGALPSQRAGFGAGTGRDKLAAGRWLDALVTGWDRKVRIPLRCLFLRREAMKGRGFFINLQPVCFEDPFAADYDAIYLAYAAEIIRFSKDRVAFEGPNVFASKSSDIFLCGRKRNGASSVGADDAPMAQP